MIRIQLSPEIQFLSCFLFGVWLLIFNLVKRLINLKTKGVTKEIKCVSLMLLDKRHLNEILCYEVLVSGPLMKYDKQKLQLKS